MQQMHAFTQIAAELYRGHLARSPNFCIACTLSSMHFGFSDRHDYGKLKDGPALALALVC